MYLFHILLHLLGKKSAFQHKEQLPCLPYQQLILPNLPQQWFTTDQFSSSAKNHCAAVCIMNTLLYYGRTVSFSAVHSRIGNGPVFRLRKAKHWFQLQKIRSIEPLKESLSNGKPCALMLSTPRHEWHWVLVTALLEYENGQRYLRIADGWHSNGERYLPLHHDHDWIYCISLK